MGGGGRRLPRPDLACSVQERIDHVGSGPLDRGFLLRATETALSHAWI